MGLKNQLTTADHLKYEDYERFVNGLHNDKNYFWEMYARVSFCTGLRASDVLNLRWIDVVNKSELVTVEQKTGKMRRIKFNDSVKAKFLEIWKEMGEPNRAFYIFHRKYGDQPVSIQYINSKLKYLKYKYALPIKNFSTHTFRKTFGRFVYDTHGHSAESLMLLNQIFNHTSIQITKRYIGITQDEIDSVFDAIKF